MTMRIDAHQHFWRYSQAEYDWIDSSMQPLRRDRLPRDLKPELDTLGIAGSVAVQARQTVEETRWLLSLVAKSEWIRGVVGWVPLAAEDVGEVLEELADDKRLKGVRHVIQGEKQDDFVLRSEFNRGVAMLQRLHLTYDLLILERQLSYAAEFVDRHPLQVFVLDHLAKPKIAAGELQPWASHLRELARRPNVFCKISGMVTEADHHAWRSEQLTPYFEVALDAFGPNRLLFGSDWPVCLLASSYAKWFELVSHWVRTLSSSEQRAILGGNAERAYRL